MNMFKKILIISIALFSFAANGSSLNQAQKDKLMTYLEKIIPTPPSEFKESPIKGLFVVMYGAKILYVSPDGRFVFEDSPLIDLSDRSNHSDKIAAKVRKKMMASLKPESMVVFKPKNKTKHIVAIFTDIDCPYCQRLHQERHALLEQGIEIRYLLFPRTGKNTKSYQTAQAVWCSKDRAKAMTEAKEIAAFNSIAHRSGGKIKPQVSAEKCDDAVDNQMKLLYEMNLQGATPQIILQSGEVIRGYMPAADLIKTITASK